MNFINLKIKICLAKEEMVVSNDEIFISESDVNKLTKEIKELKFFKSNKTYNADLKSPKPFKVMDEPPSDDEDMPEITGFTEWDWERVDKLKNEILA